ncbi:MAG: biopolymer transporter ExbB [Burkholderiales bacterium PBB6]|jgi:biopolymer transport protein ExbB|nr:MAG: biopolymer transporter ExbB [Burkholderiales bacterium PBB6]
MNFNFFHDLVLVAMAGLMALALIVIVERLIYNTFVIRARKRLLAALTQPGEGALQAELARPSHGPHANMVAGVRSLKTSDPERMDLKVQALYLEQQSSVRRGLWLLDTTITLSPLLGLLGTILGIIDTFTALAAQGVSDPQAVSRGIGTALIATAAGIGIAVFCLVFNNFFTERVERINEELKVLALGQAGEA